MTNYIIRIEIFETTVNAANERVSDSLSVAKTIQRLSSECTLFVAVFTQQDLVHDLIVIRNGKIFWNHRLHC